MRKPYYYIALCSFGKDSLAMLLKIKELNLPLNEVFYCDIRFDDNLSGEMPLMADFIPKAEKILLDFYNIQVTHIKGITFKEQFYKSKLKGNHIGEIYGYPYIIGSWCNSRLKLEPIRKYISNLSKKYNVIQYIGIAYDEPKRVERLSCNCIPLLYNLKITENDAYDICLSHNLLSPIYKSSFRSGCWFCVKQPFSQLRYLYENYKYLWDLLVLLEQDSRVTFKPNIKLKDLEQKYINNPMFNLEV